MTGNRPHSAFTRSTNVANDKGRSSGSPHIRQSSHPVGTVTIGSPMSIEVYSCGYSPGIERTALTGFPIRTFPRAAGRSPLSGTKVKFFRIKPNFPFRISESTDFPGRKTIVPLTFRRADERKKNSRPALADKRSRARCPEDVSGETFFRKARAFSRRTHFTISPVLGVSSSKAAFRSGQQLSAPCNRSRHADLVRRYRRAGRKNPAYRRMRSPALS